VVNHVELYMYDVRKIIVNNTRTLNLIKSMGSYCVVYTYIVICHNNLMHIGTVDFIRRWLMMFMVINVEYYLITTNTVSEQHSAYCLSVKKKTISLLCVQHKLQYFPEILLRSVLCKKVEIKKNTARCRIFYYHLSGSLLFCVFDGE